MPQVREGSEEEKPHPTQDLKALATLVCFDTLFPMDLFRKSLQAEEKLRQYPP